MLKVLYPLCITASGTRGVHVCVSGVVVCVYGVVVCVCGVDVCVYGVDVCVYGVGVCVFGPSVPVTPVLDAALSESLGGDKVSFDEKAFRFAFNGASPPPACSRGSCAGLGK